VARGKIPMVQKDLERGAVSNKERERIFREVGGDMG
jgi:hypothetical protein